MTDVDLNNNESNTNLEDSFFSKDKNIYETITEKTNEEKPSDRCHICNKKLGLIPFKCYCDGRFCAIHRQSYKHNCDFDYKEHAKKKLEKDNPLIRKDKIEKI